MGDGASRQLTPAKGWWGAVEDYPRALKGKKEKKGKQETPNWQNRTPKIQENPPPRLDWKQSRRIQFSLNG